MATVFTTSVVIDAPTDRVWAVLLDLDRHSTWRIFTPKIETELVIARQIVQQVSGNELRWDTTIGPKWFFRAERVQHLEPLGDDRCRYLDEVTFSGLCSPMAARFYGAEFRAGSDRMVAELARRADPPLQRLLTGEFVFRGKFDPTGIGADQATEPLQFATPSERIDKSNWQLCHACTTMIPVEFDHRIEHPGRTVGLTGTISYVCPRCRATQIGTEPDHELRDPQRNCHVCQHELGDSLVCPRCGMLRYWAVMGCPWCGSQQAVVAPHLANSCDLYTLQCVCCETCFVSLCIC